MNEVKQVYTYLKSREDYYKQKIKRLQEKCPHENIDVERGANTDNWDYSEYYWVVVSCQDCGLVKRYDRDDNPEEYKRYVRIEVK